MLIFNIMGSFANLLDYMTLFLTSKRKLKTLSL